MDSFFPLFFSLLIGVVASNAALLPAEVYWHSVLPNTRMPPAISDLLSSGGVGVVAGKGTPGGTTVGVGKGGVHVVAGKGTPGGTTINVDIADRAQYNYAATKEQLRHFRRVNFYFLEQDLRPGSKMNMQFEKPNAVSKFLSKSEADTIPFSSKKLPEITTRFSVQPGSDEEEAMKETLRKCEDPVLKGEKKICATSLESMVDFSVASLGTTKIKAASTTLYSKDEAPRQEYTIVSSGVKNLAKDELVACHHYKYAYAVFYCHLAKSTNGYTVKMTGKDGTMVEAVAVCHTDTSAWNPKHVAFQLLKVKPGTVPVCHFLAQGNVVFSRSK